MAVCKIKCPDCKTLFEYLPSDVLTATARTDTDGQLFYYIHCYSPNCSTKRIEVPQPRE